MDNKDLIRQITIGDYKGEKIEFAGITHLKYEDCKEEFLINIGEYRVHQALGKAFLEMQNAAKKSNINLEIVSAFRSIEYQKTIFPIKFKDKLNPTEEEFIARLEFSAPAGFSEHHTGLAIDINSLEQDFADTLEYEWLKNNAKNFGFEMSFPENNWQGLGFEPWHWRYVGDEICANIFKPARLKK